MSQKVKLSPPNSLWFFLWLLLVVFFLLWLRLIDIQLIKGQVFADQALQNRYFFKPYLAERGVILDRFAQPLVKNQQNYYRLLEPDQLYSDQELLDHDQALQLMATASAQLNVDFSRTYPFGSALAHVLGYVSGVTADDLLENSRLDFDSQLGRMGLEREFDDLLQSKKGQAIYEVNALGQKQKLVGHQAPVLGRNLKTSLDPYLSQVASQAMSGLTGAVVIMDAQTGQVLTLASFPSFEPNLFEELRLSKLNNPAQAAIAQHELAQQLSSQQQVFFNRALSGAYPPGSTFKLITALAALEAGAVDKNTIVEDEGVLKVGDYEYANWYYTQYGRVEGEVDLLKAIARSNDIYFYKATEWLGPENLANFAKDIGLGQLTGIELSGEAPGLVPDPTWKEETRGEQWYLGNTYHFGIGQGDLLLSPLQVAHFTQMLVNDGVSCQPSLLNERQQCQDFAFQAENLALVLEGMLQVAEAGGTAFPFFDYNSDLALILSNRLGEDTFNSLTAAEKIERGMLAGKTGTAEFGGADERGYRHTHAWFTAAIGLNKALILDRQQTYEGELDAGHQLWLAALKDNLLPEELVITVLVESDDGVPYREGSADAAPVVREIVDWLMLID